MDANLYLQEIMEQLIAKVMCGGICGGKEPCRSQDQISCSQCIPRISSSPTWFSEIHHFGTFTLFIAVMHEKFSLLEYLTIFLHDNAEPWLTPNYSKHLIQKQLKFLYCHWDFKLCKKTCILLVIMHLFLLFSFFYFLSPGLGLN